MTNAETLAALHTQLAKSHDSLAFHLNQLTTQVTALRERVAALERPWWQRIFRRNK